jgi:hypothetical protein
MTLFGSGSDGAGDRQRRALGRRSVRYFGLACSAAALAFSLGGWMTHRAMAEQMADGDARLALLMDNMARSVVQIRQWQSAPDGAGRSEIVATAGMSQTAVVDDIKRQIQSEMGLFPVRLLRERGESFVELNAVDSAGKTSYGTAGYLGDGYFITVKHGVMALGDRSERRAIEEVKIRYRGIDLPAQVVDAGDADSEVHTGDWAIIRVRQRIDLRPLRIDTAYAYEFAEPIFRLGNDYSKGIILSTGYVGQRTSNGLVTCLTDGHPGVSGGGVLDQEGDLVGIPVGRMQGDYRFSFILPLRAEMFRRVPALKRNTRG